MIVRAAHLNARRAHARFSIGDLDGGGREGHLPASRVEALLVGGQVRKLDIAASPAARLCAPLTRSMAARVPVAGSLIPA